MKSKTALEKYREQQRAATQKNKAKSSLRLSQKKATGQTPPRKEWKKLPIKPALAQKIQVDPSEKNESHLENFSKSMTPQPGKNSQITPNLGKSQKPINSASRLIPESSQVSQGLPKPTVEILKSKTIEAALEEVVAAAEKAREEAELQKEIAEELEKESAQTSQLVKEDFSPVNSSREKLVMEYSPLIKYIAQKIAARLPANIELDDLISSGVIGLMDAIDKYDATRDNKFKTYAEFRIRGAILDELRAQDWVPRSIREKAKILERCYSKLEQQNGRQANDEEVCKELGITQEEFHDLLNQVRSVSLLSYDDISSFSKNDKRTLHGLGDGGGRSLTPFNEVNTSSIRRMIARAIEDLPEKQRLVLSLYYFEDLNLKEIGRVLDVTESRVSQLHTQAILKLKAKLKNNWDEFSTLLA